MDTPRCAECGRDRDLGHFLDDTSPDIKPFVATLCEACARTLKLKLDKPIPQTPATRRRK
jgi:hypothetical protein